MNAMKKRTVCPERECNSSWNVRERSLGKAYLALFCLRAFALAVSSPWNNFSHIFCKAPATCLSGVCSNGPSSESPSQLNLHHSIPYPALLFLITLQARNI